ncbi:dihydrolipoamide acetyltransferase component of pyruvate dehydrogenase complex [Jejuia pallidilutea]|uniref:Dihydrolipoamide acetyltransferase component of pyruvate dehydrogenase complex n=1 Tax=Jejuia pallidilutea TaxID=504487 RepID=A0A090VW55_9FLAO|nr:dihydrolipoamide acetyltransferase component of pyruvate dehydrogenase complex [Jejuia pallidilutea]
MEEGTVATWLKKVGDKIEEGDILAEIETDKATMEFESFNEGTLLHIGVQEGETTKVDELLAIIGDEGEDISDLLNGGGNASAEDSNAEDAKAEASDEVESNKDETTETEEASNASADLPEGVIVVTMPRLSDTMEEGTVATWLKKVGDSVEEGDILAEIETDKATMEFESFQSGTLLEIGLKEGESAKVDELLAIIGPAGTDVSGVAANFSASSAPAAKKEEAPKQETKKEAPKTATASTETKTKAPAPTPVTENGRLYVSPLAKKLAEEKGINLTKVQGSGENGRIIKRDIENYEPAAGAAAVGKFVPSGQEDFEDIPNSQMRKAIAKSLTKSKFSAPHYYLAVEFNMDNAMAFRAQFNSIPDTKISFNDIVVKACALALKQHPQVNSQWFDDKMRLNNHVHIGVAVAVPDGLVVPVVRFANEQSLPQIGLKLKH